MILILKKAEARQVPTMMTFEHCAASTDAQICQPLITVCPELASIPRHTFVWDDYAWPSVAGETYLS